jgi:hypothetical protein
MEVMSAVALGKTFWKTGEVGTRLVQMGRLLKR